jgi:circadian clock protein KaiC
MRGTTSREGWHDYKIRTGGIEVFPALVAAEHVGFPSSVSQCRVVLRNSMFCSTAVRLRGTSTLVTGPAGSGKSTLSLQYVCAAAARIASSMSSRNGSARCLSARPSWGWIYRLTSRQGWSLSVRLERRRDREEVNATLEVRIADAIDPAQIAPGEFAHIIRKEVVENGARLVVIDSLNGYLSSMPQEKQLVLAAARIASIPEPAGGADFSGQPSARRCG